VLCHPATVLSNFIDLTRLLIRFHPLPGALHPGMDEVELGIVPGGPAEGKADEADLPSTTASTPKAGSRLGGGAVSAGNAHGWGGSVLRRHTLPAIHPAMQRVSAGMASAATK
jgi:hypothetical protein